jgi:CheY-like chemotaxis protein
MDLLLPSWGLHIVAVDTAQEAQDHLRRAAGDFACLIVDLSGRLPASVRALHRVVSRDPALANIQQVWLYGEEPVASELRDADNLMPRQFQTEQLRTVLFPAPMPDPTPLPELPPAPAVTPPPSPPPAPMREPIPMPVLPPMPDDGTPPLLLVEDNPINLAVAKRLLAALGYRCDHAENGEQALERMASGHYRMVLMDCLMPVLDGYGATRRWREREARQPDTPRLTIVAMTANAMAEDRQRCLDAGMDDYLSKPISREVLADCLRRWLPVAAPNRQPATDAAVQADATPAAPAAAESVDMETLEELREIAGDETGQIVALFLEDTPRLIAQMTKAATHADHAAMRMAAHTLKSSAANLGAVPLSLMAKRIELDARAQRLEQPAAAVSLLDAEFARVRMALLDYLSRQ